MTFAAALVFAVGGLALSAAMLREGALTRAGRVVFIGLAVVSCLVIVAVIAFIPPGWWMR